MTWQQVGPQHPSGPSAHPSCICVGELGTVDILVTCKVYFSRLLRPIITLLKFDRPDQILYDIIPGDAAMTRIEPRKDWLGNKTDIQ